MSSQAEKEEIVLLTEPFFGLMATNDDAPIHVFQQLIYGVKIGFHNVL